MTQPFEVGSALFSIETVNLYTHRKRDHFQKCQGSLSKNVAHWFICAQSHFLYEEFLLYPGLSLSSNRTFSQKNTEVNNVV